MIFGILIVAGLGTSVLENQVTLEGITQGNGKVSVSEIVTISVDLDKNEKSGLIHAISILKNIKGLKFVNFDENDVIRHDLVKKIIKAYSKEEKNG